LQFRKQEREDELSSGKKCAVFLAVFAGKKKTVVRSKQGK
jgi:hypothetical protein